MNSVKALADTNLKISEAKNLLFKLQEDETEYLINREKKALDKISKVFVESKDLLDKTHQNYEEIHQFCKTVSEYADFLAENHSKFQDMLATFHKRNELWEENVKKINQELADQRHAIKQDTEAITEREKRISEAKENIKKEKELIESRQQALLASYRQEKDLWDKLKKTSK